MKLRRIFPFLVFLVLFACFGCNNSDGDAFFPYFKKKKALNVRKRYTYGYMDKNGEKVTNAKFSEAHVFTDGLGCVSVYHKRKYLYGYIDPSGNYKIKPKYAMARPFREKRAVVSEDRQHWKVINTSGKALTDAKYDIITDYYGGYCYGYIYRETVRKRGLLFRRRVSYYDCYRIDQKGNEYLIGEGLEDLHYRDTSKLNNMDQLGMYWETNAQGRRLYGYKLLTMEDYDQTPLSDCGNYDDKGKDHIKAQFIAADCFEGGYARVKLTSGKSAYIDTEGKVVCTFTDDH